MCGKLFSSSECERESDGSTASATSIPVEYGEHESLPMTSTQFLSCENLSVRVNSVNTRGISCPTPADQSNKDCQILAMLGPDTSEEQKLDVILNFPNLDGK